MGIKLYDSELKVMEILWKEGELTDSKNFKRRNRVE